MENLKFEFNTDKAAKANRQQVLVGVVASGNLEALVEKHHDSHSFIITINTPAHGFSDIWQALIHDFVKNYALGGLQIAINDGGARPDTVALRLAQALRLMEEVEA